MKKILSIITLTGLMFSNNISGVTYFEFEDSFSLSRTYFTYKKDISDELSFKFQTDVGRLDDNVDDERWTGFLKKAQLDWKVDSNMKISMGMIGMNMLNIQEKTWGHRFMYKSAMDLYKFSATADLGFAISRKHGNLTGTFMISNGEGYKESNVDDNNKTSVQLVWGETKLNKNDGYNIGLAYSTVDVPHEINDATSDVETAVTGFFAGWAGNGLRIGLESNTKDVDGVDNSLASMYATYKIKDNLSVFLRMDDIDENTDDVAVSEEKTLVGLIWTPTKGLDIALNKSDWTKGDPMNCGDNNDEACDETSDGTTKLNFQFKF